MDYPGGPNITTRVLKCGRGRKKRIKEKSEDVTLMTLKIGEGATSQ